MGFLSRGDHAPVMTWNDIIEPITVYCDRQSTIESVIQKLSAHNGKIAFILDGNSLVGYCTHEQLLFQISQTGNLKEQVSFKSDILKVPLSSPIEFFHNVSLIIGVRSDGEMVGYTTIEEAQHKISNERLTDLNLLLQGAGVGIIRTNSLFGIEYMNETAEKILGLPSSFLLLRNYQTLLNSDRKWDQVLNGETLVNVVSNINYKHIIGNFYPFYVGDTISGLIHIFFERDVFEESVQELDFVRNLNSDLQAVYASSQEQILVINSVGVIVRIAGTFLADFWKMDQPEQIVGKHISEFTKKNMFQPNIFEICQKQMKKVQAIQSSDRGHKIWSIATPVYHEGNLEKVVILSRDLSTTQTPVSHSGQLPQDFVEQEDFTRKLVFRSKKIKTLVNDIKRVAPFNSTILLEGESGVGKEIFAQLIHSLSPHKEKQLVRINCGAIPENLIESELFGYEKGAFTGASKAGKAGLFEVANNSTLFLDEIGELPLNMQVKLLRVLQEKEITRIGGTYPIPVNVRIITATNRNLKEMVSNGEFREDLYYRLNVIPFRVPPLRERKDDLLPLTIHFLESFNDMYQIKKNITPEAIQVLEAYDWPGNIRELQNIIERMILLCVDEWIQPENVVKYLYGESQQERKPLHVFELLPLKEAIEELEIQLIEKGMKKYETAHKLSKVLGVSPATISRRMRKLNIP